MAHFSLSVNLCCVCYLESGCSRHMTGNKEYLTDYIKSRRESVTFVDGVKNKVVGMGTLNIEGMPKPKNVLHVEGMKVNLIIISHLCDEDMLVYVDKRKCYVTKGNEKYNLTGTRTVDNYYQMNVVIIPSLWQYKHIVWNYGTKRLGHVNYNLLHKLRSKEIVRGIPQFKKECRLLCGDCQVGKLTRVKHAQIGDITTNHILEVLHIHLFGLT